MASGDSANGHPDRDQTVTGLAGIAERAATSRGLVLFLRSIGWSHDLFQRPHQLARAFARHGWVAVFEDADSGEDDVEEVERDLFVTRAPFEALRELPVTLLWTFTYNYDDRDRFPAEVPCVYDWIDDLSVFHHDPALLERNHLRALEEATVVAAVARRLVDEARAVRPDALYLPNGVDVDHFAPTDERPDDPIVDELLAGGRPVAGYFGALAEWFDFQLLHDTAVLRPDWAFLLIGPQYSGTDAVRDQPALRLANVRWIGPRPYRQLPTWLGLFDVATIPFRINDITRATSPLKLYEYFAGAKPVITTPMPECAAHPEVRVVAEAEAFAAALDPCRELGDSAEYRRRLRAVALESSWSFRVAQVLARLEEAAAGGPRSAAAPSGPAAPELVRELTIQRARATALDADLGGARRSLAEHAERIGRLTAEVESTRERADLEVAAARERSREADADAGAAREQVSALRRDLSDAEARAADAEGSADEARAEARAVCAELEALRERAQTELAAARADAAAWREEAHRGPLARFLRRRFPHRPEGRLTFWRRSLYYAVAGRLLRAWRRGGRGMASWYQYRFLRYRREREERVGFSLEGMRCPSEPELVSVVLPVYNGERMVAEAVDSVLAQSWEPLELIAVDDGSTDRTPEILAEYARHDPRVAVLRQENQKLPRALSNGFRRARGELLTWTSDDNRMKRECLERLVGCLRRHPGWEMAFANVDIIGDDGEYLHGSEWYYGYQVPPGSPHVHLPGDTSELNTWANNSVGAAFLYRDRVAWLLGDYCPDRFTIEDYDYWMLINELLTLRHADFPEPVYDYRFHGSSLTARDAELKILERRERLMVFDDFRRDFALSPLAWIVEADEGDQAAEKVATDLRRLATTAGHLVTAAGAHPPDRLPRLWFPSVYVRIAARPDVDPPAPESLPPGAVTALVTLAGSGLPHDPGEWTVCATLAKGAELPRTGRPWQGWLGFADPATCFRALDVAARVRQYKGVEAAIRDADDADLDATVVVCTYRRSRQLAETLGSIARQTLDRARFEVVVVNNDPAVDLDDLVDGLRQEAFPERPDHVRLVLCPFKGLSHARNAGIAEARGRVLCFIDDDAVAEPDWLARTLEAYADDCEVGVVGGRILLRPPEPAPPWLEPAAWSYWSHFDPGYPEPTVVESWWEYPWGANWSARRDLLLAMGGFRYGYGRKGNDFGGGEEIVAASLARRLGAKVVVAPSSVVHHHVDPARFTRADLRRTIRAGTFVNYFTQRDLYVPTWLGPAHLLEQMGKRALRLMWPWRMSRFQRLETRSFLRAEVELLRTMLGDWRARARREG